MKQALAVALMILCGAAPAAADTLEAMFENTVEVRHPTGSVQRYYFEPDGAFRVVTEDGMEQSGRWRTENGQICVVMGDEHCSPLPENVDAGGGWSIDTPSGSIAVTIVEGR